MPHHFATIQGSSCVTGSAPVKTLVNALGGNAVVRAIYDGLTASSVTIATGVSSWADARGSGFGIAAVQATGASQPAYNAGTGGITFDGSAKLLTTPVSTLFNLVNPVSWAYILTENNVNSNAFHCLQDASSSKLNLWSTAGVIAMSANTGSANSIVSTATTPVRLVVVSASGTSGNIDIPNKTRVTGTITALSTSSQVHMYFGGDKTGGRAGPSVLYAAVCIGRVVTAADLTALMTYGSQYSVVAA